MKRFNTLLLQFEVNSLGLLGWSSNDGGRVMAQGCRPTECDVYVVYVKVVEELLCEGVELLCEGVELLK